MADKIFSPVRVRAATQEAAIDQALQMTGASREDIDVELLEETEQGVTIRIVPRGTLSAKEEEKVEEEEAAPSTSVPAEEEGEQDEPESFDEPVQDEPTQEEEELQDEPVQEQPEAVETVTAAADENETEAATEPAVEEGVQTAPLASPEVVEYARSLAQEMLDTMGLEAQAHAGELPDWCLPTARTGAAKTERTRTVPRAFLNIEGDDVGILIGKHGQTLQSFQYLLNLSLNNTADEEEASAEGVRAGGVHVVVDAGEYRERRASALERTALDAAARAKRERRPIRMEPMPAHERRLVHLALSGDHDIVTSSEGREPWRRVVVTPTGVRALRGSERSGGRSGGGRSRGSGGGQRSYGSSIGYTGDA